MDEISRFIGRAFDSYRRKHYGDIVWAKELESIAPEERERVPLAMADLYFKIEEALDQDPHGQTGQALAARWMELVESRTDGHPDIKSFTGSYEAYFRWIESWPPDIQRKVGTLNMGKIGDFILKAIAQPLRPS
jgi:hypothetical protein